MKVTQIRKSSPTLREELEVLPLSVEDFDREGGTQIVGEGELTPGASRRVSFCTSPCWRWSGSSGSSPASSRPQAVRRDGQARHR